MNVAAVIDLLNQQVADGVQRIEQQRALVQSLRTLGHKTLADEAEEFLSKLLELQSIYTDELTRLRSREL